MMRHTSRSDDERHRLPVALIVVAVTLGLLAAGCSGSSASTETVQTPAASSTAATAETNSTAVTGGSDHLALVQEVDGRRLFLECRGSGSPTVILQSGFGNAGDIWSLTDTSAPAVFPALAESNRVCVYDRPGSMITTTNAGGTVALADSALPGRSDPAPMPRDPAEVVTELHDLLAAADVRGRSCWSAIRWAGFRCPVRPHLPGRGERPGGRRLTAPTEPGPRRPSRRGRACG